MGARTPISDEHCESQPCLVIEILSESTKSVGCGEKLHDYPKVPVLGAYLLVSQKERRVDVYQRSGGMWLFESANDNGEILLACPRMKLTLVTIYENAEVDAKIASQLA